MAHDKPIAAGKSSFDLVDTARVFEEIGLASAHAFFDVACGSGRYSLAAAEKIHPGGIIYAADLWPEGVAVLREAIRSRGLTNIEPLLADVSKRLPLADHTIDLCLMATVLHDLVEDRTAAGTLAEIRRLLRPGGTLAVIEFKKIAEGPGPPIRIRMSPAEVEHLLQPYGFRRAKLFETGPFTYCLTLTAA